MTALVRGVKFVDTEGTMPEVDRDIRRIIQEIIKQLANGIDRRTRILVLAKGLPLGNHWHTFEERFRGRGHGKVILIPKDADYDPSDLSKFTHELPAGGWEVTVPPRTIHVFQFDGDPDEHGVIAVLLSYTDRKFAKGENTFQVDVVDPATTVAA